MSLGLAVKTGWILSRYTCFSGISQVPKDRLIAWPKLHALGEKNGMEFPWELGASGSVTQINLSFERSALHVTVKWSSFLGLWLWRDLSLHISHHMKKYMIMARSHKEEGTRPGHMHLVISLIKCDFMTLTLSSFLSRLLPLSLFSNLAVGCPVTWKESFSKQNTRELWWIGRLGLAYMLILDLCCPSQPANCILYSISNPRNTLW